MQKALPDESLSPSFLKGNRTQESQSICSRKCVKDSLYPSNLATSENHSKTCSTTLLKKKGVEFEEMESLRHIVKDKKKCFSVVQRRDFISDPFNIGKKTHEIINNKLCKIKSPAKELPYKGADAISVSYTHLTLPTNREV
eukprot:TRINITY_DN15145_c0_g1_i3.p1 TRINITY_DN15145_c0_g1~~TRINITY_DN15145_c0_g1_i3.p1  ORF type:complete len:141 (+),score=19.07 TRINITY_DN15145_c0_g1_i3:444-866(+)